jgi:cytochrome P450
VERKIDALEPYVTELTDAALDGAGPSFDGAEGLAHRIPVQVVAERVIGFDQPDTDAIRGWIFEGSRVMGGLLTLEEMAAFGGGAMGLAPWTEAQLHAAMGRSDGSVLGAAAGGVRDGSLTFEQAAFTLMVLVGAGAETTTALLGTAILVLATRPDLQARLRAEPALIPPFVEEVLRWEAPFRYHPRTVVRDTSLGGVEIPGGSLALLLWASANRDPAVFDAPDELRVDRRNVHLHFGFGRGIHHCVGAPLARIEARTVLSLLLERTTSITLDLDDPPAWVSSLMVRRHERLPIRLRG